LSGAAWRQANLQSANLREANLTKAGLTGHTLKNATVAGVILVYGSIKYRNPK
jgi:uncharacterized protein YjbI with pentapeptide repeats